MQFKFIVVACLYRVMPKEMETPYDDKKPVSSTILVLTMIYLKLLLFYTKFGLTFGYSVST